MSFNMKKMNVHNICECQTYIRYQIRKRVYIQMDVRMSLYLTFY